MTGPTMRERVFEGRLPHARSTLSIRILYRSHTSRSSAESGGQQYFAREMQQPSTRLVAHKLQAVTIPHIYSNSHNRATTKEPARKKRHHPESHMMTMLRAPASINPFPTPGISSRAQSIRKIHVPYCLLPGGDRCTLYVGMQLRFYKVRAMSANKGSASRSCILPADPSVAFQLINLFSFLFT